MSRLLLVANRLPITVERDGGALRTTLSSGGLATALRGPHEQSDGLWIGWPGDVGRLSAAQQRALAAQLDALRAVPVRIERDELKLFYEGYANGALWPVLHYLLGAMPRRVTGFETYVRINERFADAVVAHYRPGDRIWVHDYHLMLLPALLRRRLPDAAIGFFLHVPFPSSEIFRILPQRQALLEGLLGADLIGFHTAAYMRHFASSLVRVLGLAPDVDRVAVGDRVVRLGIFPISIDAARFAALADEPATERARQLGGGDRGQVLLGIDRLDYTKGVPRRLLAFEQLLLAHPELRERVQLIQVAVPSRVEVEAYRSFRREVDRLMGRIHGVFGTPDWAPVHYIYRSLSEEEVVALYRRANVMLVTPIRDGMNLVAKEFVAARTDEDGVLVLSEFAGAASELGEALQVNPYDVDGMAEVIHRALTMAASERRSRMRALRRRVTAYDVHRWVDSFLQALDEAHAGGAAQSLAMSPPAALATALARLRNAPYLCLLLDYDGTLREFAPSPELAAPDVALRALLRRLGERPATEVHIVSGRRRDTLSEWLGDLPLHLHAEHGLWSRPRGGEWLQRIHPSTAWRAQLLPILRDFTARTPGSLIEEKTIGITWHYRMVEPDFAAFQVRDLQLHLTELLSNAPVEVLLGEKVLEVRPHGVNKGTIVRDVAAAMPLGTLMAAIADDRTDEDMFTALPPDAVSIHVGSNPSIAALRIPSVAAARAFLTDLLAPGGAPP